MTVRGLSAVLAICAWPALLLAQKPPELTGRVHGADGTAVHGALVELVQGGATTRTAVNGAFALRVPQSGEHALRVSRTGWLPRTIVLRLDAGVSTWIDVVLQPDPIAIETLAVSVMRTEGVRIGRAELERMGASSPASALARLPGVVVSVPVPGGPERVSVRGSASDQVLVLVDGATINDPVTGEADLSRISVASIESIVLITGAQSARYGAGALAGVVLIETRVTVEHSVSAAAGSLGRWNASGITGGDHRLPWSAGASWRSLNGVFDFELPKELGSTRERRVNADARAIEAYLTTEFPLYDGFLRARFAAEAEERGLPGQSYAPSRFSRQELRGGRALLSWDHGGALKSLRAAATLQMQRTRFQDHDPPFGLPYDDTVHIATLELRADRTQKLRGFDAGAGISGRIQRISTATLDRPTQPGSIGAYVQTGTQWAHSRFDVGAVGQLRADYDRVQDRAYVTHSAALSVGRANFNLRLTQRTAFSPPALGDQFFRSGIGIEANPDLRAERANELELGARWQHSPSISFDAAAYKGVIDDLIVWAPDYRFVWSPQNENVVRSGVELSARAQRAQWLASAAFTHARITYDRIAGDVQVAYRPRNSAALTLERRAERFDVRLESSYIGRRTTAPTALNTIPGFWTTGLMLAVRARPRNIATTLSLRADRLFDEESTLIFGFPDPGRQLLLELRLGGSPNSKPSTRTSQ
jgi:vitamin B12 transporter